MTVLAVIAVALAASCGGGGTGRVAVPTPSTTGTSVLPTTSSATAGVTSSTAASTTTMTTVASPTVRAVALSLATLNRADATAVASWAARAIWTLDTAVDTGQRDAELRAAAVFTPSYAAGLQALPRPASPGAEWATWTMHHVTTTVGAVLQHDSGAPIDTPTMAYRSFYLTINVSATDGSVIPPKNDVEFVTLTNGASGWAVSRIGPNA